MCCRITGNSPLCTVGLLVIVFCVLALCNGSGLHNNTLTKACTVLSEKAIPKCVGPTSCVCTCVHFVYSHVMCLQLCICM